jgi:mannose-6-phosphate isomerase-like protein (cupin superfamily)
MSIKETILQLLIDDVLYKEELVKHIDHDGVMHTVQSLTELRTNPTYTVKIEGVERISRSVFETGVKLGQVYNHRGPITCHLFWAKPNSPSFKLHTDPYDVFLKVIEGTKVMEVDGGRVEIVPDTGLFHLKGCTPHRAVNEHESWMLSFGLDTFIEERGST